MLGQDTKSLFAINLKTLIHDSWNILLILSQLDSRIRFHNFDIVSRQVHYITGRGNQGVTTQTKFVF